MYEIWADDLLIHSDVTPLETVKAINPVLTLEDSAAGSLEFSLPPVNVGYSDTKLKRMVTNITVKENGEWLWSGRILQDSFDFWKNRKITCEGELAFLNDSIQPPHKYQAYNPTSGVTETTIESFFYSLIDIHNAQVAENRQFSHGEVTVVDNDQQDDGDAIYRFTNYETTLQCINDKLVDRLKGHIRIRHVKETVDGVVKEVRKLDYVKDDTLTTNSQVVRFGVNLLDFSKNIDMTELATVLVPRGERLDLPETDPDYIEGLEPYLTVKTVETKLDETTSQPWHTEGEIFVQNPNAVANFGRIAAVVDWSDVTDANTLYNKAKKYLEDEQYEKVTLEIQALDLKYLSNSEAPIKFQTKLRCVSEPHGMDHTFIVSKMQIDLSNPANCVYTLGTDIKMSLTQASSKVNQELLNDIKNIPSKNSILKAARENAFQILMGTDGGYVRFEKWGPGDPLYDPDNPDVIHAIIISDKPTDEESTHKWVWNEGGLGHFQRPNTETEWASSYEEDDYGGLNIAITMDGKINCNALYGGRIYGQWVEGCTIFGNTVVGGEIKSGRILGEGTERHVDEESSYGSVKISGGQLYVRNGTSGFAKFEQAYDNSHDSAYKGEYCTIGGSRWYNHYYDGSWHDYSFNTRDLCALIIYAKNHEWI